MLTVLPLMPALTKAADESLKIATKQENFIPKRRKAMIIRIKQGQIAPFALRILSAKGAETEAVFFTVQALVSELASADMERVCVSIPDTSNLGDRPGAAGRNHESTPRYA